MWERGCADAGVAAEGFFLLTNFRVDLIIKK